MAGKNVRVKLERVIIKRPSLFKKVATQEGGTEKYRAKFALDPETKTGKRNIKIMEEAIDEALMSVFGKTDVKIKEGRSCLFDGSDIEDDDGEPVPGYDGMMIVKAASSKRPQVKDRDKEIDLTEDDDKITANTVVNAHLDVWATNDKKLGGNGVFANIIGVQFVEEGEGFSGGKVSDDDWDDLDDDEPKSKKSKRSRDDDDDDDEPKSKKKASSKRSRDDDDDDEDDEPKAKKKSKRSRDDDEDEDDEDEKPKKKAKRSRDDDDDDEDDHPRSKSKAKSRRSRDDDDDDLDDEDL